MAKITINNNDTGLVVRTALNSMFTELYGNVGAIPIKLTNQTESFTYAVSADTWVERITITPILGTPDIKIGTSLAGSEIIDTTQIGNYLPVIVQQYFTNSAILYFVISGGTANLRLDLINPYA
jgi:hypothetical protein